MEGLWKHYGIMEAFILKVDGEQVSKVESSSVSLLSTLTWGIDILFEKLTPQIGTEFKKHFLHTMPLRLGSSCKACLLFLIFYWCLVLYVLIIGLF